MIQAEVARHSADLSAEAQRAKVEGAKVGFHRLNLEGLTPEIRKDRRGEVPSIIHSQSQLSSPRNKVRRRSVRAPEGAAR
jgi:hypothetical protein